MNEEEMISQIKDLISDRKTFITDDEETSEIFKKDIEALEMILDKYNMLKESNLKVIRIINKVKDTHILYFDKPLWDFVKRIEKTLYSSDKE